MVDMPMQKVFLDCLNLIQLYTDKHMKRQHKIFNQEKDLQS